LTDDSRSVGVVNVRDLTRRTSEVIDEVEFEGHALLVTRRGVPVATINPIDHSALEDFVLANAPDFDLARAEADADLEAGRTIPLQTFLSKLAANNE
jgi:prevent-host-death family protein